MAVEAEDRVMPLQEGGMTQEIQGTQETGNVFSLGAYTRNSDNLILELLISRIVIINVCCFKPLSM